MIQTSTYKLFFPNFLYKLFSLSLLAGTTGKFFFPKRAGDSEGELDAFYLSGNSLRILYNSLILPYLFYCNLVWGNTYKSNLQRLVILQKRALRIINKSKRDAHTDPIFKKHKLLKCHDIHSFQLGVFMFLFINSALPTKFHKFLRNNQIHSYNTRNACSFHLPLCRTNIRKFSVVYQGPKFFNSLTPEIAFSSSLSAFKKKLKEFLISKY